MHIEKLFLQTAYLKTLGEFYASVLELQVKEINEKEIGINIGTTELVFFETNQAEPFYHFAINIPSNKIEEAKAWLVNKVTLLWVDDYQSEIAEFTNWRARSVYFYDPAGNILELIARFDLNSVSQDPFSSKQFLSISEVGLVFKNEIFESSSAELLSNYSLSYFSKQPPLSQFRAIGDDAGLFIVVPEHRNWYPTNKPAEIFPIRVKFENLGDNYLFKS